MTDWLVFRYDDRQNMQNGEFMFTFWLSDSSHVTALIASGLLLFLIIPHSLFFNLSSYGGGGSEVMSSDQWEVGQRCQSTHAHTHTHKHTHIKPHHVVRKCWVQSSSAHCKPVVVISVLGL